MYAYLPSCTERQILDPYVMVWDTVHRPSVSDSVDSVDSTGYGSKPAARIDRTTSLRGRCMKITEIAGARKLRIGFFS